MTKNKKIILFISIIIIVIGIVVTFVAGFNKGTEYKSMRQVTIYLGTDVDVEKIRSITDVVFGRQPVAIQKVELFNDTVAIATESITDEQLAKLIDYTNQEYGLKNNAETTEVTTIPGDSLRDKVVPYALPVILSLAIILIYMGVKAKIKKENILNAVLTPLCWTILVEGILFSIIAICRIPVNMLTMPIAIAIMIITLTVVAYRLENVEKENE